VQLNEALALRRLDEHGLLLLGLAQGGEARHSTHCTRPARHCRKGLRMRKRPSELQGLRLLQGGLGHARTGNDLMVPADIESDGDGLPVLIDTFHEVRSARGQHDLLGHLLGCSLHTRAYRQKQQKCRAALASCAAHMKGGAAAKAKS
jgi:hypothetical protein